MSAIGRISCPSVSTRSVIETFSRLTSPVPASILAAASRSLTIPSSSRAEVRMFPACRRRFSSSVSARSSAKPIMLLSGVRNSCETLARNSFLMRSVSYSATFASANSLSLRSSARFAWRSWSVWTLMTSSISLKRCESFSNSSPPTRLHRTLKSPSATLFARSSSWRIGFRTTWRAIKRSVIKAVIAAMIAPSTNIPRVHQISAPAGGGIVMSITPINCPCWMSGSLRLELPERYEAFARTAWRQR